jgi:hypothetical protein
MSAPTPAPFYYLDNFQTALDWLAGRCQPLLGAQEQDFLERFPQLPQASQALLVRLLMRKGPVFRVSRLGYIEIGPTAAALQPLLKTGWIEADPLLELDQLFSLLTRAELDQAFPEMPRALRKHELQAALAAEQPAARRLQDWWQETDEQVIELHLGQLNDRLRLMFFGNLRQDWSTFVLAFLGVQRFEQMELAEDSRGFQQPADIDAYLHLYDCRCRFEAGEDLQGLLSEIPSEPLENLLLERRRGKLLFQIGRQLERLGDYPAALRQYQASNHPEACVRAVRVLELQRQPLERMLARLQKQLGLTAARRRPAAPVSRLDLCLPRPEETASVEWVVREHLQEQDGPVHYVENSLLNSLFGLLCWEAIFAPLPGAFFHPFHSGPADLHEADFYPRRAELFQRCLAQLDSDAYQHSIRQRYREKHGILSPFVYWEALDEDLLDQALHCLPAEHLKRCFERLLGDIRANRAGMPDLIQFWPAQKRYRMIEVKGPGDRLQDNQKRWLAFCAEHSMPVEVCYVQWQPT